MDAEQPYAVNSYIEHGCKAKGILAVRPSASPAVLSLSVWDCMSIVLSDCIMNTLIIAL